MASVIRGRSVFALGADPGCREKHALSAARRQLVRIVSGFEKRARRAHFFAAAAALFSGSDRFHRNCLGMGSRRLAEERDT